MDKKEKFTEKVLEKYGDLYDVSSVDYIDAKHFIYPYCKKHKKVFKTTGDHFLHSEQICNECKLEKQKESQDIININIKSIKNEMNEHKIEENKSKSDIKTIYLME